MSRATLVVDGLDGSGKSHLARLLVSAGRTVGLRCALVHVDDFRRPVAWPADPAAEARAYFDHYYDFSLLSRVVADLCQGVDGFILPRFDGMRGVLDGEFTLDARGADLVVVEGVMCRRATTLADAPGVQLSTTWAEATRRLVARDGARGRPPAEVERRIRHRYRPAQERYLAQWRPGDRASLCVDNQDYRAPVVGELREPAGGGGRGAEALRLLRVLRDTLVNASPRARAVSGADGSAAPGR